MLPAWFAAISIVPVPETVSVLPEMVPGPEITLNDTGNSDVAVAVNAREAPFATVVGATKLIDCGSKLKAAVPCKLPIVDGGVKVR